MTVHKFNAKLKQGEAVERELDDYFVTEYEIEHATREEQRRGIDRYFTHRATGERRAVDYKADWRAHQTGNAFIETVSVDTVAKAGWAVASESEVILYYLPQTRVLYVVFLAQLRRWLPLWMELFPAAKAQNEGYSTHGVLIPISELEDIAESVVEVP